MATPAQTEPTTAAVKAASDTAAQAVKVAQELKTRLDKAVATPETIKAAAEALVDTRWVDSTDVEKVARAVADPNFALRLLAQIAQTSAEKLAALQTQQNPRLDSGEVLGPTKRAADAAAPADVANERWHEKMASYRRQYGS